MTDAPVADRRRLARLGALCLAALSLGACTPGVVQRDVIQGPLPYARPDADADAAPGLYQIPPGATPDGTFRASIARGATVARGTLSTDTLRFPITLQGVSASGAAGRVDVNGQVFGLGTTNQILGTYRQVGATAAGVQTDLTGGLQLGNDNLVVIRVFPAREGQVLTAAPEGVTVTLQR